MVYGLGNVFSKTFAFFLIPLYINHFGKLDYANLMLFQITTSVLTFLLSLNSGVFYYYYNYDNSKYRKIIFSTWLYYQLIVSALLILLSFLFLDTFTKLYIFNNNLYELKICFIISVFKLIPYSFNSILMNKYRVARKPWKSILVVFLEALFSFLFVSIAVFLFQGGIVEVVFVIFLARMLVSFLFSKGLFKYLSYKNTSTKMLSKVFSYTWPFIVSSIFSWVVMHIDKFIGSVSLVSKDDNAILALSTQIAMPILIFSEMIGTSLGPYIMSVKDDSDAKNQYQNIFELVVISSLIFIVLLIFFSPIILEILADNSYELVLYILPLIVIARFINIMWLQFSIGFSLSGNTAYIMYSVILGGVVSFAINYLFMEDCGIIISGLSQILSCFIMLLFIYFASIKVINFSYSLKSVRSSLILFSFYFLFYYYEYLNNFEFSTYIMLLLNVFCVLYFSATLFKISNLKNFFQTKR